MIRIVKSEVSVGMDVARARSTISNGGYYLQILEYLSKPESLRFVDLV